jgi:hypothetical protein
MTAKNTLLIYFDATVPGSPGGLAAGLKMYFPQLEIRTGSERVEIPGECVTLGAYRRLPEPFRKEARGSALAIVVTRKPYENNYFWDCPSSGSIVVVSLHDWESLTDLPEENGIVYFLATLLADEMNVGTTHQSAKGCLNDFHWNKADVDFGIRAAFVCAACEEKFLKGRPSQREKRVYTGIKELLNDLSQASRAKQSITALWQRHRRAVVFDAFVCHNSADKPEVRKLVAALRRRKLNPWFDEEQLRPGQSWMSAINREIETIRAAIICVGPNGNGPWQRRETEALIEQFVQRDAPVIPVILPTCQKPPELPPFLRTLTWVDLRKRRPDPIPLLVWGITGERAD